MRFLLPSVLPVLVLACRQPEPKNTEPDDSGDTADSAPVNTAPSVADVVLSPAAPRTNDVLTVSATAADPDGDAVTLHYAWTVDGVPAGNDGPTLDGATAFDRGNVVSVTVTPNDGTMDGAPVTVSVTADDTPPEALTVTLAPAAPGHGDDLDCSAAASDADGDALTYTFAWTVDGVPYGRASDADAHSAVSGDDVLGGTSWTCTVTASDPDGASITAEATVDVAATCDDGATYAVTDTARSELETINAVVTDADADGYDDILFVNQLSSSVTLWWGGPSGPHAAETTLSMGRVGYGVDAGDVDGDGFIDVIASNQDMNTFTVALGSGPRSFSGTRSIPQSGFPQGVTLIDADRDGDLDLVSMLGSGWGSVSGANCNALLVNDGAGNFAAGTCLWSDTHIRRAADLDGDGYAELITSDTGEVYSSASGAFTLAFTVPMDGVVTPSSVFPYDVDADGDVDVVVADGSDYSLTTVTNHGGGVFRGCDRSAPLSTWPNAVGDLDADGDVDFASVATCGYCASTFRVGLRD